MAKGVRLLRWPLQGELREECRARGVPRILVLEAGMEAPVCEDIYEDWVRTPIAPPDLRARIEALLRRYCRNFLPTLDENGVLWFGSRSVTLSPTQANLLVLLVARFGHVVPREALRYQPCEEENGRPMTRNALDLHMMRIRQRVGAIGLTVHTVWGRGYVLDTQHATATEVAEAPTPSGVSRGMDSGRRRPEKEGQLATALAR